MNEQYTTGAFAKKAHVTVRTIRYYDKVNLLKPSYIGENGYRYYSDRDFFRLQKILILKKLGFPLSEIYLMIDDDSQAGFEKSLLLQIELINKNIEQMNTIKLSLQHVYRLIHGTEADWSRIVDLIQLLNNDDLVQEYKDERMLELKISLHKKYAKNAQGWYPWLLSKIDFTKINRLLEIGCGNGEIWKYANVNMRNREIFLTDISDNMLQTAKKKLGNEFNYMVMDGENITFRNCSFDAVVANHVLFYFTDLKASLKSIVAVLKPKGLFYCTAYGNFHMEEINNLVKEFDQNINLVDERNHNRFFLETGESILKKFFTRVDKEIYNDYLVIDEYDFLIEYILSCQGNQNEIIGLRLNEFKNFVKNKIENEALLVHKYVGLFICEK